MRMEALASTKHALAAMLVVAVMDGSVFPVPPFALLVPMVLAQPHKWVRYAVLGTVASLFGGLIGYWLGSLINAGAVSFLEIDLNMRVQRFGIDATLGQLLGRTSGRWRCCARCCPRPSRWWPLAAAWWPCRWTGSCVAAIIGRTVRFFLVAGVMRFAGPKARKWLRV